MGYMLWRAAPSHGMTAEEAAEICSSMVDAHGLDAVQRMLQWPHRAILRVDKTDAWFALDMWINSEIKCWLASRTQSLSADIGGKEGWLDESTASITVGADNSLDDCSSFAVEEAQPSLAERVALLEKVFVLVDFDALLQAVEKDVPKIAAIEPCLRGTARDRNATLPGTALPPTTPPPAWLRCEMHELQELLRQNEEVIAECGKVPFAEPDELEIEMDPRLSISTAGFREDKSWIKAGADAAAGAAEAAE